MITLLNSPIKEISHIVHCADIHVRLNSRHTEYRKVFENFYESVKNSPETAIVVIAGDIFHNKADLAAESVQIVSEFLNTVANIRPTILIAGNHDGLVNNKTRLDSLTPIVDAISNPNLFYLKTTGLYGFGNILFNNMSVFDQTEKYIRFDNIPSIYKNEYKHYIALFHGPIDGVTTELGYRIVNPAVMAQMFDGHHIVLCGDIHLTQNVQTYNEDYGTPFIRYPGSMIQQNHGEAIDGHGYSLWNLNDYTYIHNELINNTGYFTINVDKGNITSELTNIPEKVYLRLKLKNTIPTEAKSVVSKIKELSEVIEVAYVRDESDIAAEGSSENICKNVELENIYQVGYQNKLIEEYLSKKMGVTDKDKIDRVLELNRKANLALPKADIKNNIKWHPIRFEWSNMFSYGEDNVIDFSKMDGVYGVFGTNRLGKSSLASSILFCLFDKMERGSKGNVILNNRKSSFKCKMEFVIDDVHYFIERRGSMGRNGAVKVDVDFWRIVNGNEESLNGTERDTTNDIIRSYIGTFDDFVLTSAAFQRAKNNVSFMDMNHSERKDLLVKFIGLNIFDQLIDASNERSKELKTLLKSHKDKNYADEKANAEAQLIIASSQIKTITSEKNSLKGEIEDIANRILEESKKLIPLDDNIPTDIQLLTSRKDKTDVAIKQKEDEIKNWEILTSSRDAELKETTNDLAMVDISSLSEKHAEYKNIQKKIEGVRQQINSKKIEIKGKLEKVNRLKTHEFDPNCKYCIGNSFVKDAYLAEAELSNDRIIANRLMESLNASMEEVKKLEWTETAYDKYIKLLGKQNEIKDAINSLTRKILINKTEIEKLQSSCKSITEQISIYYKNKISVENNIVTEANISKYTTQKKSKEVEMSTKEKTYAEIVGKIHVLKTKIEMTNSIIEEIRNMEMEYDTYQTYLTAIGRDGIPYQVICDAVPHIEAEVNSILTQITDFSISFETDGKNVIPYIVDDAGGKCPLENASGFEGFISSIAIRNALVHISNLPKCNFGIIDEGWSAMDIKNMQNVTILFNMLKSQYDWMIVISHNDIIKDMVTNQIEISKNGKDSRIYFT